MKCRILFAGLLLGVVSPLLNAVQQPKIDAAKDADIRRLLEVTGTKKLMQGMQVQMLGYLKDALVKQLPPGERGQKIAEAFQAKMTAHIDPEKLLDLIVPIYDKHLTHEEIKNLILFYESPLGKRLIEVQPQIIQESSAAGIRWGQEIGEAVGREMEVEYPELRSKPPGPPQ